MKHWVEMLIGVVFVVFVLPASAVSEEGGLPKGQTLYLQYCETCHGQEGTGDGDTFFQPPIEDLTSPKIQQKSDKNLWESIHMGKANTAMGMWRFVLSDEEIDHVLLYVRSLAQ